MTPEEATKRLIRSRQVHSGWAQAFAAGTLAAPAWSYIELIRAEVVELKKIADAFPAKAATIANLIERYEVMARHMMD